MDGNAKEKTLTVQFDQEEASLEDIRKAAASIGYEAEVVRH